jgi:hypothetical protein
MLVKGGAFDPTYHGRWQLQSETWKAINKYLLNLYY